MHHHSITRVFVRLICGSTAIEKLVEVDIDGVNQDDVALLVESEQGLYNRLQSDLVQIEEVVTAVAKRRYHIDWGVVDIKLCETDWILLRHC